MPQSFGVCRHPPVLVHLASHVELMVNRPLLKLALEFLSAITEASGHDMTPLQNAACPRIAGVAVGSSKLALGMVEVLVQNVPIRLDRNSAVLPPVDRK